MPLDMGRVERGVEGEEQGTVPVPRVGWGGSRQSRKSEISLVRSYLINSKELQEQGFHSH